MQYSPGMNTKDTDRQTAVTGQAKQALQCLYRGQALVRSGELQDAIKALQAALDADPNLAPAQYELGNALRRTGQTDAAEKALLRTLDLEPGHVEAHISLAFHYQTIGRLADAIQLLRSLADNKEVPIAALHKAAGLLADFRCTADAAWMLEEAARRQPLTATLNARLGQLYQKLGRFEDAGQVLEQAIRQNPDAGATYLLLANNRRATNADRPLIEQFEIRLADQNVGQTTQICLRFALGKLHDDLGEYDHAFAHYREGNRLRHAEQPFDRVSWERYFIAIKQTLHRDFFNHLVPRSDERLPTPLFVVGMLRSGTTLTERLLSGHPEILGLGERELLEDLAGQLVRITGASYPECLLHIGPSEFRKLADMYRAQWPQQASGYKYVLDKNPLNFMHLGLVSLLFPSARIIHCRRDPMDTCLSIYFQNFAHPRNSYAYDLEDIGWFYQHYASLMSHWESNLPLALDNVDYETLATDPESMGHTLISSLQLDWQPGCLEVNDQPESISTASLWQARQPIYRHAIGRAQYYREYLAPLAAMLKSPDTT